MTITPNDNRLDWILDGGNTNYEGRSYDNVQNCDVERREPFPPNGGGPSGGPPTPLPTARPTPSNSVSAWKGFSIMPRAVSGQETEDALAYTYTVSASFLEVQDPYKRKMPLLGWRLLTADKAENNHAIMIFQKDFLSINIVVAGTGDETYDVLSDR